MNICSSLPRWRFGLCMAAWLGLSMSGYAQEGPFETNSFSRNVSLSANLEVEDSENMSVNDLQLRETWRDSSATQNQRSVFINGELQDSLATANGQAKADVSLTNTGILFDGLADVFISGQQFGFYNLSGSGSSNVELVWEFYLEQELPALLSMKSDEKPDGVYQFQLIYLGATADSKKQIIWSDTAVYDYWGTPMYEFTRPIALKPGSYRLRATLASSSWLNNGGRIAASFHLRARPTEPPICCLALTASCLACAAGLPVADFCALYPKTQGCGSESFSANTAGF